MLIILMVLIIIINRIIERSIRIWLDSLVTRNITEKFWIDLTRVSCRFARSAPILKITAFSKYPIQHRCAKMSVDMRVARDRVALFLSESVSKISLILTSWSSSQRVTKRTGRRCAREKNLLRSFSLRRSIYYAILGSERRKEKTRMGEMRRRSERGMREGKTKRPGREGGFTAKGKIVKLQRSEGRKKGNRLCLSLRLCNLVSGSNDS